MHQSDNEVKGVETTVHAYVSSSSLPARLLSVESASCSTSWFFAAPSTDWLEALLSGSVIVDVVLGWSVLLSVVGSVEGPVDCSRGLGPVGLAPFPSR